MKLPLVTLPVSGSTVAPSERGKNSYQEPNSARWRSANIGYGPSMVTISRSGFAASSRIRSGDWSAARRASTGRSVSWAAAIAPSRTSLSCACVTLSLTRSKISRPSVNISSTSTPAGILRPAACCHVPIGSDQACTSKVQAPATSGVTHVS